MRAVGNYILGVAAGIVFLQYQICANKILVTRRSLINKCHSFVHLIVLNYDILS
jgi:hypothetical protein